MRTFTLKPGNVVITSYYKKYLDDASHGYNALSFSMMTVVAVAGAFSQYVKLAGISHNGTIGRFTSWVWLGSKYSLSAGNEWEVVYSSVLEYALACQKVEIEGEYRRRIQRAESQGEREAMVKAHELSRNTVTRALIHASDNGYCNETAVALISAGHKLPVGYIDVKVEATLRVELNGAKDYYVLRDIYGRTKGNLESLIGERYLSGLSDLLYSKPNSLHKLETAVIAGIDLDVPAPVIRPTEEILSSDNYRAANEAVFGNGSDD